MAITALLFRVTDWDLGIKVEGDFEKGKPTAKRQYLVEFHVDDKEVANSKKETKVAKSTNAESGKSSILPTHLPPSLGWFSPSSTITIKIYRKRARLLTSVVGLHRGKVVDLLENDTPLDLTDKKGDPISAKMKTGLSRVSESDSNAAISTASTVGKALQLTKNIMDNLSHEVGDQVHPILKASWTVLSRVYEAVQATDVQDDSIRELADTLREMLGGANVVPDLPVIAETTNILEEISRQSIQIASLIDDDRLRVARILKIQISDDLKGKEIKDRLGRVENTVTTIKDNQLAEKIYKWLSAPDSSRNRNEALDKRQADTCSWFLDGERFHDWIETPGFLWIKGKAGCGKSILCASVVDKVLRADTSLGTAYFFFDGRDSQKELQAHDKCIRSLISQFSHKCGDGIPTALVDLYRRCGGHQQPSICELQDTLQDILKQFTHAYIIIDALDECTEHERTLKWTDEITETQNTGALRLHLMVTSRPLHNIETVLGKIGPGCVDVGDATENRDISTFIEREVTSKFEHWDEKMRDDIKAAITKGADGSFRWVSLQLDALAKCLSPHEVNTQLAHLPKGLDETYKRILATIDRDYIGDTRVFLQWLAFSKRPMTVTEVAEAATVELESEGGPVYKAARRYQDPRGVLLRCSSLVTESQGTIKLSHFSVKEYLLSAHVKRDFRISKEDAHSTIAQISVAYLLQFDSFEPLTDAMLYSSPLAQYAAKYWISHVASGDVGTPGISLIVNLFNPETAPFINWVRIWDLDQQQIRSRLSRHQSEIAPPLYYASRAGLQRFYGNALQAASGQGHEAIVKLLLKKGANVNVQGGHYHNALQAASSEGHEAVVKVLLQKGAEVNAQGGRYHNALQAASSEGHESIMKLLLQKGAEVDAQGPFGNALKVASLEGREALVKLLLEKGADVNAQGGFYGNALQAASFRGHEAIVKLLLEKGAEVNAQGGEYGNALQAASRQSHEVIMKLLLEKGAEVNAQGGLCGNALQAAMRQGHEAIVKLLLEKGAKVNAHGGHFGNALQAASFQGSEALVKLLLEKGAEVNAQGGYYGNALQAASKQGHKAIVKLLLEKGAEIMEMDSKDEVDSL
ncbi:hypothetical protein BDZ97DRAFT_1922228 [Flammula alnicola]|nr:hypothetical protein BDZ97DRAFT_1922228 [Flammula alnicola]